MPDYDDRKKHCTDLDDCRIHVHMFNLETDVACDHQHVIQGISGPAIYKGGCHVHCISGRTSFLAECDNGHWHAYEVMTGPNRELSDNNHTHYFAGETHRADGHCHCFADVTGVAPNMDACCADECECPSSKYNCKHTRAEEEVNSSS